MFFKILSRETFKYFTHCVKINVTLHFHDLKKINAILFQLSQNFHPNKFNVIQ